MTAVIKAIVLKALYQYRGDDYERALAAFRYSTVEQMGEQYGQSGKTRQEILDGYQEHVEAVEKAIAEVKAL